MLSGINAMMWKTQDFLHKKPQIVPGALLTLAGSLVLFRHMTHEKAEWQDDSIKTFLAMILVQMLPLVALEMKIMSCADPVGLFCKFATPVTLIHAVFLGMRLIQHYLSSETIWDDTAQMLTAGLGFAGALMTMTLGFRQSLANIVLCKSVWGLMVLGFVAAFATNMLDSYLQPAWKARSDWASFNSDVFTTANSYIEILAFVPAVLMVYREGGSDGPRFQIESSHTKRIATVFFLFLVGFYITEDLVNAYQAYEMTVLASLAHIAHFMLLTDFAVYVLAHIYNPENLVGELRRWLPVDAYFSQEV